MFGRIINTFFVSLFTISPVFCKYCCNNQVIYPLNAELNPICHLLALLGAHHILHVCRIRVNDKI